MMKQLLFYFLILSLNPLLAQQELPILKTTSNLLDIKDGDELRKQYWWVSPKVTLDIYIADKTNEIKTVVFYSDIDSISFRLKPNEKHDFIILLNDKDTCYTQIKSGLFHQKNNDVKETKDTIPFTLTSFNNISVKTIVNKIDTFNLMFHTGSNAIAFTKEGIEKMSKVKMDEDSVSVETWGGEFLARESKNNTLQIGNFKLDNITITEDQHSGQFTDGKFGPNFFGNSIIEIDYDNNRLVIHSVLPKIDSTYEKFNLVFKRSNMFIEGTIKIGKEEYQNQLLIHSGFGGTVLLDDEFISKYNIDKKLKTISESELRDSYGNVLKTKKAILPFLEFGETAFSDIPIGFFEGAVGGQKMSVLGGDILKRFNIIFDLQHAYIYLKPNELNDLPYFGDS